MIEAEVLFRRNASLFTARHTILGNVDLVELWQALTVAEHDALYIAVSTNRWVYADQLLHSNRDPVREAARVIKTFEGAQSLVCVSVGAGFLLGQLPLEITHVLILEPTAYCVAMFILAGQFISYGGVITLLTGTLASADALEEILPWLQGKNLKRTQIYCHAPLMQLPKSSYTRTYERVQQLFEKRSVNQATIVKFQQLWNKNIFLNQRRVASAGTLSHLLATPPPKTIVLAGAGPSLSKSFVTLEQFRDRYVLFAVDTAFIPLVRAGIQPDFIFSADPQWVNHFFAQDRRAAQSTWIMDPVVCPAIPHYLTRCGARILFWNNVFAADAYFREYERGDIQHGGSVSTNAFDVAVRWLAQRATAESASHLILVGQDLSFSDKQAHCKGAVLESQVFMTQTRTLNMESHNFKQMRALPVLWEKGIRQRQVATNAKLKIFLEWFSARAADTDKSRVRLINATDDGAQIRGIEHVDLHAILTKCEVMEHKSVYEVQRVEVSIDQKIINLLAELNTIVGLMQASAELARDNRPSAATIAKLNANDEKLKDLPITKQIVGLNAQAIILKITEMGEAANAVEFYRAMLRSAREIRHWVRKMAAPALR